MFYFGETVWSIGCLVVETNVDWEGMVSCHVKVRNVAAASKGVYIATVGLDGCRVANFIGNLGSLWGGSGDASVGTISVSSVRGSFVPEVVVRVAHSYGVVVDCVVVSYGEIGTSLYDSSDVSGISPVENGCRVRG